MRMNVVRLKRLKRLPLIIILVAVLILGGGIVGLRSWYQRNLNPVSAVAQSQYFSVASGSSLHQIGVKLKSAGLIRNTRVFETYVRSNELHDKLQAGTYSLSPSMSVNQIVEKMVKGDVARNLLTILPQKRLDEIKQAFAAAGYLSSEIEVAFNPASYRGHPVLASLPAEASLEGFLYPDSFEKQSDTPAKDIVRQSLDLMQKYLTAEVVNGFAARSLNVYQGVILASIVAEETDNPKYQPTVAQVLLSRLQKDMPLQADVTTFYATALSGQPKSLSFESPYNTHLNNGLPPGPISNMTYDALQAVAHPSNTDYLYFVAGDDEKIYFSRTEAEHTEAAAKYCKKKCQL